MTLTTYIYEDRSSVATQYMNPTLPVYKKRPCLLGGLFNLQSILCKILQKTLPKDFGSSTRYIVCS
jgi:hypothetical protein